MKNSVLYIIGAVALLGGGAFLFLKNKKTKDKQKLAQLELEKATGSATTGGATTGGKPTGSATTNPEQDLKTLEIAKGIATQLKNLRNEKESNQKNFDKYSKGQGGIGLMLAKKFSQKIAEIDKKAETLNITLKAMGYSESNGNVVKI